MYVPPHNRMDDRVRQLAFMREYSFAALVTVGPGGLPCATHLPFAVEEEGPSLRLVGHLARANPQCRDLAAGAAPGCRALVIFQGPHAYVSPSWYERQPSVPTWNYAAVHASGPVRLLRGPEERIAALRRLTAMHDPAYLEELDRQPQEFLLRKLEALTVFEIGVTALEARWKLSQERSPQERRNVAAMLQRGDAAACAVAAMMRDREPPG